MTEKITVFHAEEYNNSKIAVSPFGDKTFVFETYTTSSNQELYNVLVSQFVLNIPLEKLTEPVRTHRRKTNLDGYYGKFVSYLILDIDDVKSEEHKSIILDYFKDYRVILGESKSYNNISKFNMKGVLFTSPIPISDGKLALSVIHHDLKDYCTIDESVTRKASLNAPIGKNSVFLNNENGNLYSFEKHEALRHIDLVRKDSSTSAGNIVIPISNLEELQDTNIDSIEKLCLKIFQSMNFIAIKNNDNNSIQFKHPNEEKSKGGYFWFHSSPYTMNHGNSTKSINIFNSLRKLKLAKELMQKNINYNNELLNFNTDTSVIQVNEKYLKVTDEIQQAITSFLLNPAGLLSIRSPMGTGKSTIINAAIEEAHAEDMRVLIITNRISVAQDFAKKYNIKIYNQDKYELNDSLICQYDSLWKYNIRHFDLVIMDEFISLMMHSRSNLNNSSINISKFFAAFNKKLIIADAFLTGYENFLLNNKDTNVYLIDNTYRDPTTLYSYKNLNYFIQSIIIHSEKNKITISATSLAFINSLKMLLSNRGLKVVTLTAGTPESTKDLIYNLFDEEEHDKWDILIYSPTLTVGVSNLNKINYHFHYDSSRSTDSISSIQMIKRTRKTKEIHLFVHERINYIKTSYDTIRDDYINNLGKSAEKNYLFDINEYGETKLSELGKNAIKIDTFKNILEFNHKASMEWMMKYHFLYEPRVVNETFSANVLNKYKKEIKENKDAVLQESINDFIELNNIEKTNIMMDANADKTLKVLVDIDENIKECNTKIKTKILELALKDANFITKCRYYKVTFNFTKVIWEESDIKNLISASVMSGEHDDLQFYNSLLSYGQKEIFDEYNLKTINRNTQLKYILDKCGYKTESHSNGSARTIGSRSYRITNAVKEYYGYIN